MTDHIVYSTKTNRVVSHEIRALRLKPGEHLVRRNVSVVLGFLKSKGYYKKDEGSTGAAGLQRIDLTLKQPEDGSEIELEHRILLR